MQEAIFHTPYSEWQHEYQSLLELDRENLSERLRPSETAIFKRLQAIRKALAKKLNVGPLITL